MTGFFLTFRSFLRRFRYTVSWQGFFVTFRIFLRRFRYTVSWQGFFLCGFSVILYNVCFKKYKILLYGRHPYFHNFDLGALAEVLKNPYRHDMFRVRRIWLRLLGSTHSLWIVAVSYYSCPTELFWLLNIKKLLQFVQFSFKSNNLTPLLEYRIRRKTCLFREYRDIYMCVRAPPWAARADIRYAHIWTYLSRG